ncbi:MAG TPA: GMC family oxidoreductase N-terminal domain-containing protein [Streptosporangiaceae bacterium]|nr:GMC family oxidoreductase N-terminal domain-containing protein [Streptosporangiaceae bacterium]
MAHDDSGQTAGQRTGYDYVVVGGGTAGAVVAARLSEDPRISVGLLEWGPSDRDEPRALQIRRWAQMLESEYDLDYPSVPQPRGNSLIRQSRARILGGCSSHNTMIALLPPRADFDDWASSGARGWDADAMAPYFRRLRINIAAVAPEHRNPYLADVITAASGTLGIPAREDWNTARYADGTGFLPIGYYPQTGMRSSSSVAYLHPILDHAANLDLHTGTRALKILMSEGRRATGVLARRSDGSELTVSARREVIVCCGAIDTPRLLLLSGIGPAAQLRDLGIDVVADLPGVGANLTDHPEGLVVWEAARPVPPAGATDWDMTIMYRTDPTATRPDVLAHVPLMTFAMHAERLGYRIPARTISMTPNVARPRSRGTVSLASPDPDAAPVIDYRYFTDPDRHDERTLLAGMRMARGVAAHPAMAGWIASEVFPGPEVRGDEELSALARATSHTVYHVSCTARMGMADDPAAVLDPELRVRGVAGLRIVDASAFPSLPTVNPVVAVLMLAERGAELIAASRLSGRAGTARPAGGSIPSRS